jgi:hypothetical protein
MMPAHAAEQNYEDVFTGGNAYAPTIDTALRSLVREQIGADRFDAQTLRAGRSFAASRFDERTDAFTVLWQNGLLGYGIGDMETGEDHFYRVRDEADDFLLPDDADYYVLHSCLIDALGIRAIGERPVLGFRRGRRL